MSNSQNGSMKRLVRSMTAPIFNAGRSLWKRATKFGLSSAIYAAIGGSALVSSFSGVDVNFQKALTVSSYFRGVNLLANAVGKTQFTVKSGVDEVPDHPANQLVKFWANHHQLSADIFRRTLLIHALMHGNGYGRIIRHSSEPIKLVILDPRYVVPMKRNGVLVYKLTDPDIGESITVGASSMIHIKALSIDGWVGLDPIRYYASETLGLAIATQKFAAKYYENGGQPTSYIHSQNPLNEKQWNNFEENIAPTLNSDLSNPYRMPVLEQMDIKSTGLSAEQTQLLEARKVNAWDIANLLGIPPHKLGLTSATAYKSLEEENKAFREDAVEPWLVQFEVQFRKLLTEEQQERETHRVEANRFDLTRTDMKSGYEALAKATGGAAFLTPNDARKLIGNESHEDGDGLHKPPTNPADNAEGGGDDSTDSSRSQSRADIVAQTIHQVQAMTDVYSRMTKRLAVEAVKRSAKSGEWPDYLNQLSDKHEHVIRQALSPIVPLCGGRSEDVEQITAELIHTFHERMKSVYDTATSDEFVAAVSRNAEEFKGRAGDLARQAVLRFNA